MVAQDAQSATDYVAPPMTAEEEDALVYARLANDERPLRRVTRKFHAFSSLAPAAAANGEAAVAALEEAREAFLVELASFQLLLNKNALVCEAEARQVDEYERERARVEEEQERLRTQIMQLKSELEQEQLFRKQKLAYDEVAERVNVFPDRDELQQAIDALEAEITGIEANLEAENKAMLSRRAAFDAIVSDLENLRLMGKEPDDAEPEPEPEAEKPRVRRSQSAESEDRPARAEPTVEEDDVKAESGLNPRAQEFRPRSGAVTPAAERDGDIEMGELEEEAPKATKVKREELEEGEASDGSELTQLSEE